MKKRVFALLLLAAVLLGLAACVAGMRGPRPAPAPEATLAPTAAPTAVPERVTAYEPTCTAAGYTLHEDIASGSAYIVDGAPALGHDFSSGAACARCGWAEPEPAAKPLPRIELHGSMDGISKQQRVTLGFDFAGGEQAFSCYAYTTWQGHSSLEYPKKNYTVRLYRDEAITEKNRMHFGGWQLEHKYILKANYLDVSQARNLTAARLWGQMAASRPNLSPHLRATSNFGAVDGFPVTLWHDGAFAGLYTLNLHKDEDLYGMGAVARETVMIANAQTMDESLFRAPAAFEEDASDWELEYCGTEDHSWAKESLNALISFVMNSDDGAFRSELHAYLDVDSAIDYLLFLYATGLEENAAKDLVLIRYEDTPWMASVYDMEYAFGLNADGTAYRAAEDFLPVKENGRWSSGTKSLLWDRLLNGFEPEIRHRYAQLRAGALGEEALTGLIKAYIDAIPESDYEQDRLLYPDRPLLQENQKQQMTDYIVNRLAVLDDVLMEENKR